jgi:hypothetical protein
MQLNYLTAFLILAASTVQAAAVAYDATLEPVVEKRANCGCGPDQAQNVWGCGSHYPDGSPRCPGEWNVSLPSSIQEIPYSTMQRDQSANKSRG